MTDQSSQSPPPRSGDVIEFLVRIWLEHKRAEADAVKSWGESTARCPVVWDTGIGYQIQSQYLHQQADAVAHCTYINGKHHDPTDGEYPFDSGLTELPRLCWDVPWVEHNRVEGKPFFVYEIQIKNSTKYRAEFPYRVASLAGIQDWDIVSWHTYGPGPDSTKARPNTRRLEVGHSLDLHYGGDEVQTSAMKAAGEIFRNFHVQPAANPTTFVFGRTALYHPDSMDEHGSYGEVGRMMMPTTYRYGSRIVIDPSLDDRPDDPLFRDAQGEPDAAAFERFRRAGSMVIGPAYKPRCFETDPIRPTGEITYDWRRGYLMFDAPGAAMYTGFYARLADPQAGVTFPASGTTLRDVVVNNPPNMPFPVTDDERYIAFALTSMERRALRDCPRAIISLVSTSFNTSFSLDRSGPLAEFHGAAVAEPGELPVLTARVGATVRCPALKGMAYTFFDWEMQAIGRGSVTSGTISIPANEPIFFVQLERS